MVDGEVALIIGKEKQIMHATNVKHNGKTSMKVQGKIPRLSQSSKDKIDARYLSGHNAGIKIDLVNLYYAISLSVLYGADSDFMPCDVYDGLDLLRYKLGKKLLMRIARENANIK